MTAELAQREEALTTAAAEAASSREQVEQLQAELAERQRRARGDSRSCGRARAGGGAHAAAAEAASRANRSSGCELNSRSGSEGSRSWTQLRAELAQREEALSEAAAEAASSREQVERLQPSSRSGTRRLEELERVHGTSWRSERKRSSAAAAEAASSREQVEQLQAELEEQRAALGRDESRSRAPDWRAGAA